MSEGQSKRFENVSIDFRCDGGNHRHFKRAKVAAMVGQGDMEWVGKHFKIAKFVKNRTWQKTPSGPVHVMQLVAGLPRR